MSGPHQGTELALVTSIAVAGTWAGRRVRLPSATLLGLMLVAAALTVTGAATGFASSGALRSVLGRRPRRRPAVHAASDRRLGRILPLALACTASRASFARRSRGCYPGWSTSRCPTRTWPPRPVASTRCWPTVAASHVDVSLISTVQSLCACSLWCCSPRSSSAWWRAGRPTGQSTRVNASGSAWSSATGSTWAA